MAPLPVILDTFRCAFNWRDSATGLNATNVMHFFAPGSTSTDIFTDLGLNVTAAMWGCQPTTASIFEVVITPLDGHTASLVAVTGSPAKWSGNSSGSEAIPQVANLIKLQTPARGRSFRGRVFLPFVTEAQQAGGVIPSATVTGVQAAWRTFATGMGTDGAFLTVASYALALQTEVTTVTAEPSTATVRRRQKR